MVQNHGLALHNLFFLVKIHPLATHDRLFRVNSEHAMRFGVGDGVGDGGEVGPLPPSPSSLLSSSSLSSEGSSILGMHFRNALSYVHRADLLRCLCFTQVDRFESNLAQNVASRSYKSNSVVGIAVGAGDGGGDGGMDKGV